MGLAVTESLVQKGWNITIVDFNEKAGKETAEKFGSQVLFVKGNVVKYEDQVEAFVKTWEKWGRLDFVHANAGIGDRINFYKPGAEMANGAPEKPDTLVIDICLYGVVWSSYLAMHYFRKNPSKSGKLVITSSMAGLYPAAGIPLYGAAKHGVLGLTRSLAKELKTLGEPITVNCVCPGLVPTPLVTPALIDAFAKDKLTPISTVVKAINQFIEDGSITGQAAECSGEEIIYRSHVPYGNEATEYLLSGKTEKPIERNSLAKFSEERGKKIEEMLKSTS